MQKWLLISLFFFLPVSFASETHQFTLDNGLQLIVREDHRAPVVVSMVWYKIGSADEPLGITGISHVLEHMMFKGTSQYGPKEMSQLIAKKGGQENAMTSYDFTAYYQQLPADELNLSFQIEADRMRNLLLDNKEFVKELEVVKEERRLRTDDNPQALTYERFAASAFVGSPYHHPIVGWMHDLEQMTLEDIQQWYQRWYSPNNAIVVVVGDVDPKQVLTLAQQYFGPIQTSNLPIPKNKRTAPPTGQRQLVVQAPAKLPWLVMGYNVPSLTSPVPAEEIYALEVLAGILAGGDSARLAKNLVRGQQIASSATANYSGFTRFDTLFTFYATPAPGKKLSQLTQAILEQVSQLQNTLVSDAELARVKAQAIAEKTYSRDSVMGQAMDIGIAEVTGLSWQTVDRYADEIRKVTAEQVRDVAKKYLIANRLTIAELQPQEVTP
jgi:zinc protease